MESRSFFFSVAHMVTPNGGALGYGNFTSKMSNEFSVFSGLFDSNLCKMIGGW